MATPPVPTIGSSYVVATAPSPRQQALTNDLLLEIFLRIRCPADLIRASTACVSFRRLITDPIFIRRYRSFHPPPLLGIFSRHLSNSKGFHPVDNAPAVRAVPRIYLKYLPPARSDHQWFTADVRDGRVLFQCSGVCDVPPDIIIAVCDPLSRRFRVLPPAPNHREGDYLRDFNVVLAPCAGSKDETSFKVIFMAQYYTEFLVLVFDSRCFSWSLHGHAWSWDAVSLSNNPSIWYPYDAYGCFYWKVEGTDKLLKLDMDRVELSTIVLPPRHRKREVAVVEVGEGILGMFSYNKYRRVLSFYHYNDQIADKWQEKKVIPLPVHGDVSISEARQGYIIIQIYLKKLHDYGSGSTCYYYSLDIKTLKLERVSQTSYDGYCGLPYFGFPPPLSQRLI